MLDNAFTRLLESQRKERFFLARPGGNSGDLLIYKGLELYLETNGYQIVDAPSDATRILIQGGGNFDDVWGCGLELFVRLAHESPETEIIVAPNTFRFARTDFAAVVRSLKQRVHLFAREPHSYARLRALEFPNTVSVYHADDTAFLLEGTEFLTDLRARCTEEYVLRAFRTDVESVHYPFPPTWHTNTFLDALGTRYVRCRTPRDSRDISLEDFDIFLDAIVSASEVHTDRLHVGILGALLGKRVFLSKTRFEKVDGVYQESLHRYPNVIPLFAVD